MPKVSDVYHIDEDELYLQKGDYWRSVQEFWEKVKGFHFDWISEKQKAWLRRIPDQLEEAAERDRRKDAR